MEAMQAGGPSGSHLRSSTEVDIDDELSKYDNFDLEDFTLRKEREKGVSLRGDTNAKAPVGSNWLTWRVAFPNFLATLCITVIVIYEIIVLISMFAVSVRSVMVNGGLMYALSALNFFLLALLVVVVVITRNDWNLGMLTSKLGRARPSSVVDD